MKSVKTRYEMQADGFIDDLVRGYKRPRINKLTHCSKIFVFLFESTLGIFLICFYAAGTIGLILGVLDTIFGIGIFPKK